MASALPLPPLTEADVESYSRERFDWRQMPEGLAAVIHEQTDGNPLLMVTLTSHLVSKHLLTQDDGAWGLRVPAESIAAGAPEGLQEIVDEHLESDVRIIAATNRDLKCAVAERRFRDDLFYRLGVFPIEMPSLSERKEDIPLLTAFFLERFRGRLGKRIDRIDTDTLDRLKSYSWPGNIRELANVVERAMIGSSGRTLVIEDLLPHSEPSMKTVEPMSSDNVRPLAEVERDYIRSVCERCGWRIRGDGGAAQVLDLNPSTLRSRMKKLGIVHPTATVKKLLAS